MVRILPLALLCLLAACGGGGSPMASGAGERHPGLTCAPFARELSGIALYGDAADWWEAAAGRYDRDVRPVPGSVLVFRRGARLPSGHVSVVSRVLGAREIEVIQANWVPAELDRDQRVVDVSETNDWSRIRVWWPPVNGLGAYAYAAYGFILPQHPATHAELARAVGAAARYAMQITGRPPPRARLAGG